MMLFMRVPDNLLSYFFYKSSSNNLHTTTTNMLPRNALATPNVCNIVIKSYLQKDTRHNFCQCYSMSKRLSLPGWVCRRCYERDPSDLNLLTVFCRSKAQHVPSSTEQVFVTEEYSTLVRVRPLPADFRPPRFFRKCYETEAGACRFGSRCRFAHSEAEKRAWNRLLEHERGRLAKSNHHVSTTRTTTNETMATANQSPVSASTVQLLPVISYWERRKNPPPPEDMALSVNLKNYRRKYSALLFYEEEEHVNVLRSKCDGVYNIVMLKPWNIRTSRVIEDNFKLYAYLEGLTASQIVYATQASSHVTITMSRNPPLQSKAMLLRCNFETATEVLYIGFDYKMAEKFQSFYLQTRGDLPAAIIDVEVKFEVKHSYFDNLHRILNRISDEALSKVIPSVTDFEEGLHLDRIPKPKYPQSNLDQDQFRGLQTMMFTKTTAPVLIPGPFGCGKTRLLCVATEYVITESVRKGSVGRVLLCCYQQHSADIVMKDYFISMTMDKSNPWNSKVIRVTNQRYRENRYFQVSRDFCVRIDDFNSTFTDHYYKEKCLVVVTTFGGAMRMSDVVPKDFFTHIFIDEGAQTREPENLGPLLMANKHTRIIIAGDTQQVGPKLVVLGDEPQQYGLGESLLQRLHTRYTELGDNAQKYAVSLTCNYRCHVDLLVLPSSLFYNSSLVPCGDVKCHPDSPYPLKFVCAGFDFHIPSSPKNKKECLLVLYEVERFLKNPEYSIKDVCVMTPSLNQANLIRRTIIEMPCFELLRGLDVRTSYEMQGREFPLLFMSTIESLEETGRPYDVLKSLCHPAVFNTAITRAKSLVVAVGNPLVLLLAEATMDDPKWCWREFLDRCFNNNTFFVPDSLLEGYLEVQDQFHQVRGMKTYHEIMTLFRERLVVARRYKPQVHSDDDIPATQDSVDIEVSKPAVVPSISEESEQWPDFEHKVEQKLPFPNEDGTKVLSVVNSSQSVSSIPDNASDTSKETNEVKEQHTSASVAAADVPVTKSKSRSGKKKGRSKSKKQKSPRVVPTNTLSISTTTAIPSPPKDIQQHKASHTLETERQTHQQYQDQRTLSRPPMTLFDHFPAPLHDVIRKQENECFVHDGSKKENRNAFKHKHLHTNVELLKAPLTKYNYESKFHQLLCREEEEHKRILTERCDGLYNLTVFHQGFVPLLLDVKRDEHVRFGLISNGSKDTLDGDTIAYIKQASSERENVVLHLSPNMAVKAEVVEGLAPKKRSVDVLLIAFTQEELTKLSKGGRDIKGNELELPDVKITFVLKWSYFDRLHEALDKLGPDMIQRLLPTSVFDFTAYIDSLEQPLYSPDKIIELDGKGANSQMRALKAIMNCESHKAPVLVVGSFGTGKTRLLARAAYHILKEDRNHRVLICAHHQHSADTFITNYFAKMVEHGWWIEAIRLVSSLDNYRIPGGFENYYANIRNFKGRHRLVVTTFLLSLHLLPRFPKGYFTHILLDEGAQSREPESIAPLCLADVNTKIVIAGDHKQVGPSLLVLGDEAIQHGLSVSLLERLHSAYNDERLAEVSTAHCATLLTNFRCHHALLSLPSYLFYDSALVTAAEATTYLHPRANYPLHFICSSLSEEKEVKDSTNAREVDLLLREVEKYVDDWPKKEYSDLKKIGIISTTSNQRSCFLKKLRSNQFKHLSQYDIEVLPAYLIQGREFEAVFLSTAEPTTIDGMSKNPIKTPCSQYVFNTALTRAKSLVVCAGNPFLLMTIEKHTNNDMSCWKDYIRRCIVSRTFSVPLNFDGQADLLLELQKAIFPINVVSDDDNTPQADSIMRSYQQAIQQMPVYVRSKVQITDVMRWDIVQKADVGTETDEAINVHGGSIITCELCIISHRNIEAIPLDVSKEQKPIKIIRHRDRRGAFDGDIVQVKILDIETATQQQCGQVVSIVEARHPTKYVCRSDTYNAINFYPLDKTVSGIVNLPKISKRLLQYHEVPHADYITVFSKPSLQSLGDVDSDQLPQIRELIPHSMAESLLFVVQVLGWGQKYRKPLGAVIEVLPRTSNLFFTERLLKIAYDIDESQNDHLKIQPDIDEVQVDEVKQEDAICHYTQAFTIDSPDTINMDDALSLIPLQEEGTYELAVHISNVAKFIVKDGELDKVAKRRGTSVYGTHSGAVHMLPISVTTRKFSLKYKETHDVLTISATVVLKDGMVTDIQCSVAECGPKKARLTSHAQLTYEAAQLLLDDKPLKCEHEIIQAQVNEFDKSANGLNIASTLKLLYQISMKLRENRLGAAYPEGDDQECWQSQILVSELMIWANSTIAAYLFESLPNMALVRRQLPPFPEQLEHLRTSFKHYLPYSLALKQFLQQQEETEPLTITEALLHILHSAYELKDYKKLLWILSNDFLYPQLAQARYIARRISRPAEYIPAVINEDDEQNKQFAHHSLHLKAYTHFTSPIRRYFDVLVQRLVIALMDGSDITYTLKDLQDICRSLNVRTKQTQRFDQALAKVYKVQESETSLLKIKGFLAKCFIGAKDHVYQLLITDDKKLAATTEIDTTFEYSHLNINRYENIDEPRWHIVSATLTEQSSKSLMRDPQIEDFVVLKSAPAPVVKAPAPVAKAPAPVAKAPAPVSKAPAPVAKPPAFRSNYCLIEPLVFEYLPLADTCTSENEDKRRQKMKCTYYSVPVSVSTYQIDLEAWEHVHKYLKLRSSESIDAAMEQLPGLPAEKVEDSNQPHEEKFSQSPVVILDVVRSFRLGEEVSVWIGKSLKDPVPSPCLQLMEIAPTIHVCVQHNRHPSLCFSDIQLKQASKTSYHSIKEYIDLWSKVLVAEAANDGVSDTNSLHLIRNVPLEWPELVRVNNCIDNAHYKPIEDGVMSFSIPSEKLDILNFIKIKAGDLVCVRYEVTDESINSQLRAVYHFVVTDKSGSKDKGSVTIVMKSMASHCWISERMKPHILMNAPCDLQVIEMPISFNRVFNCLQSGVSADDTKLEPETDQRQNKHRWSGLAKEVSIGLSQPLRTNKVNIEWLESDPFALKLWPGHLGIRYTSNLNTKQVQAIISALKYPFQLIQGPPGTGKSVVGAHLAYIFSRVNSSTDKCVVYCCPSNKAVDVVHKKLRDLNRMLQEPYKLKIIRLYGRAHQRKDFPNPCHDLSKLHRQAIAKDDTIEGRCLPELQEDALHHKIRIKNPEIEMIRNYFISSSKNNIIPSQEERDRYKSMIKEAEELELSKKYDIVLCTCNETCSGRIFQLAMSSRIAQCIVDECGMANEPETITAASLCEHVVLIGDHKQLQPIVKYPAARECGLGKSLFERYAGERYTMERPNLLIRLNVQYRMHESICETPSLLFYDGELITAGTVLQRKPPAPLLKDFWNGGHHVKVYDIREDVPFDQPFTGKFHIRSKSNQTEALQVLEVANLLHEKYRVPYKSIAVLTPYAAQKELVTKLMEKDDRFKINNTIPKVTTIVESQGDEYNIVILTTVRSLPYDEIKDKRLVQPDRRWMTENLGFLADEHQVNVGITRAKHGLIIIGNITLLKYVDVWSNLLDIYCHYSRILPPLPVRNIVHSS